MADNKKLKKAVRERQARTGETYSTARMHVLRRLNGGEGPGAFEAVVLKAIKLADAALRAYRDRMKDVPSMGGAFRVADLLPLLDEEDAAEEKALEQHLAALEYPVLRKVEVLMYAGRGDADFEHLADNLAHDSHELTVQVIADKLLALPDYLRAGLERARDDGVDLEASWGRRSA